MDVTRFPCRKTTLCLFIACGLFAGSAQAASISGAIFTTTATGTVVNGNNYSAKDDVYLNGGPNNPPGCNGGALEDGDYYFQVTDPSGSALLSSDGIAARAFRVHGGEITQNLGTHQNGQTSPCGSLAIQLLPYDNTPNAGGVYKVWITRVSDFNAACSGTGLADCGLAGFVPGNTKTDNFRINCDTPSYTGALQAFKFYDSNANGAYDSGEPELPGWQMTLGSVSQNVDSTQFTQADGTTTWNLLQPATDYMVTEGVPFEGNWINSTTIYTGHDGSPQNPAGPLTVVVNGTTMVAFGNYCTFPPNGRTLGFWSNRNGQALIGSGDLAMLVALNLVNKNGTGFNPTTYSALRTWLLNADAVNMGYMLSAQLAAMELNVYNGLVAGSDYYVPAHRTINQLMTDANASLGLYPLTLTGNAHRADQEQLKNWLDQLNNNAGVLSPTPCSYSFY